MMNDREANAAFFECLASPEQLVALFDYLPRVYLFIKDRESRFVKVNRGFLFLHGFRSDHEVLGRTDFDFHPPALASQYVEEDRRVMKSGEPLSDQIWLVLGYDGLPRWFLSTKIPLFGLEREVVGIAGVMRPYEHAGLAPGDYDRLTPVMEFVHREFGNRIGVEELAAKANLSVSQLQREFKRLFRMSPSDYLSKVRLLMARRRLEESGDPIGTVALDCGFYDQSHFTRAFRSETGIPPLEYRRRFKTVPKAER